MCDPDNPEDLGRFAYVDSDIGMLTLCGATSMGFGGLNEVIELALHADAAENKHRRLHKHRLGLSLEPSRRCRGLHRMAPDNDCGAKATCLARADRIQR